MTRSIAVSVLATLLLSSCAGLFDDTAGMKPAELAALNDDLNIDLTCTAGEDCELKWSRAMDWLQRNSCWKLRNVTDSLITTEGPFNTQSAAFEITKFPRGGGVYEIRFRAGCGNPFGCSPSIKKLTANFNLFVSTGFGEQLRRLCTGL
jgi:hypothetical protein